VFEAMQDVGLPLLVHGETTGAAVDVFDREAVFIERTLRPLVERFPGLMVCMEHITTRQAAEFVASARQGVVATVTAHHLLYNRNALFQGGVRPHYYCLPILKRETHRQALLQAATSGNPKFFLGTDSAPHETSTKEAACGCAGCYTAYAGIELYAEAFASVGALERLEDFASRFGPAFYGLPLNDTRITLVAEPWRAPHELGFGSGRLTPLRAGEMHAWRLAD
jgi:dihydroorotase